LSPEKRVDGWKLSTVRHRSSLAIQFLLSKNYQLST